MIIYLNSTSNLGDFVQSLPVLSGIKEKYGKIDFIIDKKMSKFNGIKEFLMYQDLFNSVSYDNESFVYGQVYVLSSWTREDKNNKDRPTETCRYENWMKDNYKIDFNVDDNFVIKYPQTKISELKNKYIIGDRWNGPDIDTRRETDVLSYLGDKMSPEKIYYLDYNKTLLENCNIIANSDKPFITNFTGIGMISDLMNKETYVVWKAEDWKPEYRNGNDIVWDNGKNIDSIFEKHFYLNRKSKLIHASKIDNYLKT